MRDDPWFAGFAAGESCFYFLKVRGGQLIQPRFTIGLRADDVPILAELRDAFGGTLQHEERAAQSPLCRWVVGRKDELPGLVEYFDRFPLRAKKATDYGIWREAVEIYCESKGSDPRLAILRAVLMATRPFGSGYLGKHPEDWLELA